MRTWAFTDQGVSLSNSCTFEIEPVALVLRTRFNVTTARDAKPLLKMDKASLVRGAVKGMATALRSPVGAALAGQEGSGSSTCPGLWGDRHPS